jgi:predicted permease
MTFWILLAIAGFLTYLSLRYRNFWLSASGALGWFAVWWYNTQYPPTNIAVNSFGHQVLYYLFILLAIGTFFNWIRNRNRIPTNERTAREQAEYEMEYREAKQGEVDRTIAYRRNVRRLLRSGEYRRRR